ncbi:MAG: methyl-accepting chemotaxis protein, partial [Natronospirillum sp.]
MKSLSIAQRLGLSFTVVLSLMVLTTLIGVQRVGVIDRTLTTVSEGATAKQRYAINFRGSVHDRAIAIRDAVLVENAQGLNQQLRLVSELAAFYEQSAGPMNEVMSASASDAEEQRLLQRIEEVEQRALGLTDRLVEQRQGSDIAGARTFLLAEVAPAYGQWLTRINAFIDYQENLIRRDLNQVQNTASGFAVLMLVIALISIIVSVAVSVLIIRQLKATLGAEPHEVAYVMEELADGNLSVSVETRYPDSVMGDVRNTIKRLAGIIEEVRSAGDELSESAKLLLSTSAENRRQNELQSAETDQMATAVNEMAASVNQVTVHANDAASATRNADEEIVSVNKQVQQTSRAIQNLAESLDNAAQVVQSVSDESDHIEKIVGVIRGVAEQTNLLALNAAIEAARAGEHGRGFA